jgi:succinate dehydrogenase/fumarate reductase cytochrome b subunit
MSPHLTVYSWTIPMTMSATNRIFSFALVGAFLLLPIIDIFSSGSLASDIAAFGYFLYICFMIQGYSSAEARANGNGAGIFALKMGLLFPLWFHILLGFRHWSWDIFAVGIRNLGTFYQVSNLL